MKEYKQLLAIFIIMWVMFFLLEGWKKYEVLEKEAIDRGHAVIHDGKFRWVNCRLKDMAK